MSDQMKQLLEDVDYLISSWPALVELKVPGTTPRPRRITRLSDSARERIEALAAEEAAERRRLGVAPTPMAVTAAPVALGVLSTMARVAEVVTEVAATVCEVVDVPYPGDLASVYVDPAAHLLRVRAWVGTAQNVDDLTVPWVLERIHPLADAIATHLGEVHDGQLIEALCPWCQGRTTHRPTGGERTLVVFARQSRTEQAAKPRPDGEAPTRREPSRGPLIVCHGEACTPPDAAVGLWVGEHPAWPEREWDWLSKQLLPVDGARPVEVPPAATA